MTDINITNIRRESDDEIVKCLEELLELAKKGELRGLAYITLKPGSWVGTGWQVAKDGNVLTMIGGVGILQQRMINAKIDYDQ